MGWWNDQQQHLAYILPAARDFLSQQSSELSLISLAWVMCQSLWLDHGMLWLMWLESVPSPGVWGHAVSSPLPL